MRASTKEHMGKVMSTINEGMPLKAKDLAVKSGMSVGSLYRVIRLLREAGEPVVRTKNGYLHAEHAAKSDDVYIMRTVLGRHASDTIMLNNAAAHMRKRWKSVEEKKQLSLALGPMMPSISSIQSGLRVLQEKSERLGI